VLANAPFDPVVESIAAKPADRQVARHLLFIEPDPGAASAGATPDEVREGATSPDKPPTWAGTLWAAQTIRGQQSLTNAIEHLGELNDQVATIGHVIAALGDDVEEALTDVALGRQDVAPLTFEELKAHDQRVYDSVPVVAGTLNYRVYCRLKMARVSERLSDNLAEHLGYPKTSPEASFLRAALLQWTQSREQSLRTEREMDVWLAGLDAPYRERRLEFLIDGINRLFPESLSSQQAEQRSRPTRAQLSVIKDRAWQLLVEERDKPGRAVRRLGQEAGFASREALQGLVFDEEPKAWASEHSGEIERLVDAYRANLGELTSDSARNLWEAFTHTTERWPEDARRHLASRYAAFPLWDALLFPAQSLSRLAMYNPIRLSRVSPVDATALDAAVSGTKLLGVSFHHFGAFFGLDRRENDYLWGRLDGVELILRLLRDQHRTRQRTETLDPQQSNDIQRAAFGTVVDQEEKELGERSTHTLIARLRETIPTAVVPLVGAGTAQSE
jgi:patatin-related protein